MAAPGDLPRGPPPAHGPHPARGDPGTQDTHRPHKLLPAAAEQQAQHDAQAAALNLRIKQIASPSAKPSSLSRPAPATPSSPPATALTDLREALTGSISAPKA